MSNVIRSVSEYLSYFEKENETYKSTITVGCFSFYRGQANAKWELNPSLYREGLFDSESLLLTELKHICPNEFLGNKFDILVKMQHFGMPIRLLDTTTNPLVALYFACENENQINYDGAVYAFPNLPVSWSTDPLIDLIMDYVFDYHPKGIWLEQMLNISRVKYANVIHRVMPENMHDLIYYLTIPAFPVMPAKTNNRIEAQDGAFFVCGMKCQGSKTSDNPGVLGRVYYDFGPVNLIDETKVWANAQKLIIPAENKKEILKQLDLLGINQRKLFPDLLHQIQYATKFAKEKGL